TDAVERKAGNIGGLGSALLWLDVGRPDDLRPFGGVVCDKLGEVDAGYLLLGDELHGGIRPNITVVIFCWRNCLISESMGHHDSEIMDDGGID
ncbi:MAG: hypothetical protein WCF56_00930, partial [Pseudolabrys sp.]